MFSVLAAGTVLSVMASTPCAAQEREDEDRQDAFAAPAVFQAAGPTIASIQSAVDQYRAALGVANNGNTPGPLGASIGSTRPSAASSPPKRRCQNA